MHISFKFKKIPLHYTRNSYEDKYKLFPELKNKRKTTDMDRNYRSPFFIHAVMTNFITLKQKIQNTIFEYKEYKEHIKNTYKEIHFCFKTSSLLPSCVTKDNLLFQ